HSLIIISMQNYILSIPFVYFFPFVNIRQRALEERIINMQELYIGSLGIRASSNALKNPGLHEKVMEVLVLSSMIETLESKDRPDDLAKKVKDNLVIVRSQKGAGGGLLMSSDGFFATSAHCVENLDNSSFIRFSGQDYWIDDVILDNKHDIALGKARIREIGQYIYPNDFRIVEPRKNMEFEVYGTIEGYNQMGEVTRTSTSVKPKGRSKLYDMVKTDAKLKFGLSGEPIITEQGEIIGFVTGGQFPKDSNRGKNLFAGKATYLIPLIEEYIERQLSEIKRLSFIQKSRSKYSLL
ncbi:serine protease, partial [candidate division KSB1 bacterium]